MLSFSFVNEISYNIPDQLSSIISGLSLDACSLTSQRQTVCVLAAAAR